MVVVIRIGGSVIASPVNPQLIQQYITLLRQLRKEGHEIVTVVGGGALAREFIRTGNKLGLNEQGQDKLAINVSRLYALLIALKLGKDGTGTVPTSISEAVKALERGKVVVMGGLKPGMTTDTVAAYIAQKTKANLLIKASDQEAIYTRDPRRHKDAKKLDRITFRDLARLLEQDRHKAGIHQILDPVAVKALKDRGIKTVVVNGNDPKNLRRAIDGEEVGTVITE
jgi:uridylate kinase